ncbi:GAF domain-containing protein [Conexibacter sp. W3-3-2]|nr:GAF domain-containing protein [Conexibacter sp. W3-3-2]
MMGDVTSTPTVDALHQMVSLLADVEHVSPGAPFYDRLAEAACRMAGMHRAIIFLYDDEERRVRSVGAHGIEASAFADLQVTARTVPIALRALSDDAVVEAGPQVERDIPPELVERFNAEHVACSPMSAGGKWFGVVLVDRKDPHPLQAQEREALFLLGKLAALAAAARLATRQQEQTRRLAERIDLARDVHDHAIQRLFGVSLALAGDGPLDAEDRARCAAEVETALQELRDVVQRPLARVTRPDAPGFQDELGRLVAREAGPAVTVEQDGPVPAALDALAASVLREAVRNVRKHARASTVVVRVGAHGDAFRLEVVNDGVPDATPTVPSTGLGLRLAAFEALGAGGLVEFGRAEESTWRVRLTAPLPS